MCAERGRREATPQAAEAARFRTPPVLSATGLPLSQPKSVKTSAPRGHAVAATAPSLSSIAAARSLKRPAAPMIRATPSGGPRQPSAFDIAEALTIGPRKPSPKKTHHAVSHEVQSAEEEVAEVRRMREIIRARPNRFSRAAMEARDAPHAGATDIPARSTNTVTKDSTPAVGVLTQASEPDAMTRTRTKRPARFESSPPTRTAVVEDPPLIFGTRLLPTHVISPSPRDEGHYPLLADHG
jgi:hypothetical protein